MPTRSSRRRSKRAEKPVASNHDWDRRHLPTMQLHESEKLLVGLLATLLVAMPWAIGSTPVLSQAIVCFLAIASLGAALLPRHGNTHTVTSTGQAKRLFAFPVFWLGGLLLIYVAIQGFNAAWKVEGTEGFRWLTETDHISWLPAGVAASDSNPFRWLLIFATPFFAACAAWVGLTRRKSILLLLSATAISGFFLSAIGFYQIQKSKAAILWFYTPPNETFLSTFPYHWQGAAYLTVVLAMAIGLAAHHYARARKTFRRSNPSGLFLFIGLVVALMVIFSFSRVAAGIAGGIVFAFLAHIAYKELANDAPMSRKFFLTALALVVVGIGTLIGGNVSESYLEREARHGQLENLPIAAEGVWSASWETGSTIFRENLLYGAGAGSYPHFQREMAEQEEIQPVPESLAMEHAGSDWIRFPAEFGIVGSLLLLLIFGYLAKHYCQTRTVQNPLAGFLFLGVVAGLILGLASFTFQNVAFFTTWSLILVFGAILIRVESAARSRAEDPMTFD